MWLMLSAAVVIGSIKVKTGFIKRKDVFGDYENGQDPDQSTLPQSGLCLCSLLTETLDTAEYIKAHHENMPL